MHGWLAGPCDGTTITAAALSAMGIISDEMDEVGVLLDVIPDLMVERFVGPSDLTDPLEGDQLLLGSDGWMGAWIDGCADTFMTLLTA